MLVVFASFFPLCVELNAFGKSMYNSVASRFFARNPSMIRRIVTISEVADRFLRKSFLIFPRNFLRFRVDTIVKQDMINISSYSSESYGSVVLSES